MFSALRRNRRRLSLLTKELSAGKGKSVLFNRESLHQCANNPPGQAYWTEIVGQPQKKFHAFCGLFVSFCFVLVCLTILGLCVFVLIFSLGDVSLQKGDKKHIVEWVSRWENLGGVGEEKT